MIHNPAIGLNDYYGADELVKAAEALNVIKSSIVAAYLKRCKVSAEKLTAMMDAETWMSASECLEHGFIDEIEGSVEPVLNGNSLVVNRVQFDTCNFKNQDALKACIGKKKEEKAMNSKLEEFLNNLGLKFADDQQQKAGKEQNVTNAVSQPVNTAEAVANAVEAERQRVAALEALNTENNTAVAAIINQAKADGKTVAEIQPYIDAVKSAQPVQNAAQQVVAAMIEDSKNSGVDGIGSGTVDDAALEKAKDAKAAERMVEAMNKKFGGAK